MITIVLLFHTFIIYHMLINLGVMHANKPSHKEALVGDGIQHCIIDT